MAIEGSLDLFKLQEILQMVSQQTKTGILTVQGQQDIVAISFLRGKIVAADSLNQTIEEGLGEVLVREGLLSPAELEQASAEHSADGGRLMDLLVDRGYVNRSELLKALRVETVTLMRRIFRWRQGDFKFYSGDEVSFEEGFQPIDVEDLLLGSLADLADEPPLERPKSSRRPAGGDAAGPNVPPMPEIPAIPNIPDILPPPSPSQRLASPGSPASRPAPAAPPAGKAVPAAAALGVPSTTETLALSGKFKQMTVDREEGGVPAADRVVGRLLAALLAAALLTVSIRRPDAALFPFPWQDELRASRLEQQRHALYGKVERATKTFYLLEGSFPDRLSRLVGRGLLRASDLADPEGHPLAFAPHDESYELSAVEDGRPVRGSEHAGGVGGNFLLSPSFFSASGQAPPPVVLLD